MRPQFWLMIICLSVSLLPTLQAKANDSVVDDCSALLIINGRISKNLGVADTSWLGVPHHPSVSLAPVASSIGPELVGRFVQARAVSGEELGLGFIRGTIIDSRDEWLTFHLREEQTGRVVRLTADDPEHGLMRVELLDQDQVNAQSAEASLGEGNTLQELAALEARFELEARDLKLHADRTAIEDKMAWYRRWNGRNLRTTLYDRQFKLVRLEYLLGLYRVDEALALLRLDIDKTKIPAVAIHKALAERRQLRRMVKAGEFTQVRAEYLDAQIEKRLREQGEILGPHYGEYRAILFKLEQIKANQKQLYPPQTVAAADEVLRELMIVTPSAKLLPSVLNLRTEPSIQYVQAAFFAQPYSLMKKLEMDLWAERMTFTWLVFNKVSGQELLRRSLDTLITVMPAWARSPLNALRKNKRDMDARRFDMPQIDRLAHLEGGDAARVEELRKIYYGDPRSEIMKTFARLADREEQLLWRGMKASASPDFLTVMESEEKVAGEWGPLSKHYHQNEMNMTAAVITAGGVGSGFLFYKYGARDTWLWQAMDSLVQWLSIGF